MTPGLRCCVAFIAGRVANPRSSANSIYDYGQSKHVQFSGDLDSTNCKIYDYGDRAHVEGTLPKLYHFGEQSHFDLEMSGAKFKGYDYGSSTHFEGSVNGNAITVYDFRDSGFHQYTL